MSLYTHLRDNAFGGNANLRQRIWGLTSTNAPATDGRFTAAKVGDLIYDSTNNDWYICVAAGATFTKIYG